MILVLVAKIFKKSRKSYRNHKMNVIDHCQVFFRHAVLIPKSVHPCRLRWSLQKSHSAILHYHIVQYSNFVIF